MRLRFLDSDPQAISAVPDRTWYQSCVRAGARTGRKPADLRSMLTAGQVVAQIP